MCGTDLEIVGGAYGCAPPGRSDWCWGTSPSAAYCEAPERRARSPGDLVVGIVRRPDPVPCPYCAGGEWDMCRNGRYTEHGIKELHGFAAERWRSSPELAVPVAPASATWASCWSRPAWSPRRGSTSSASAPGPVWPLSACS